MTHVTCRLTAKNRDQLRNHTLGNRVWATFTFLLSLYGGCEGIATEGVGCVLAGMFGSGIPMTTFSNNIAIIAVTRVSCIALCPQQPWFIHTLL